MDLTKLRLRLTTQSVVEVRGTTVNQFGCVKFSEKVLAPVSRYFRNQLAADKWFDYSNSELWLYHTGNCRAEQWTQLATIWKNMYGVEDPNKFVHSAYGHVFHKRKSKKSQWVMARDLLVEDKYTRRSFIQFLLPEFSHDRIDVPCSVIATFKASKPDPKLKPEEDFGVDVVYFMRSTDILFGLPHDIMWAKSLSMRMQMDLAKAHGHDSCKLSSTSKVTFVAADLHEYMDHPVPVDGLHAVFTTELPRSIVDFIVFSG